MVQVVELFCSRPLLLRTDADFDRKRRALYEFRVVRPVLFGAAGEWMDRNVTRWNALAVYTRDRPVGTADLLHVEVGCMTIGGSRESFQETDRECRSGFTEFRPVSSVPRHDIVEFV